MNLGYTRSDSKALRSSNFCSGDQAKLRKGQGSILSAWAYKLCACVITKLQLWMKLMRGVDEKLIIN